MDLVQEKDAIRAYLESSSIIDFHNQSIKEIATLLAKGLNTEVDRIRQIYHYVRDEIKHSADISGHIVTCNASEVLKYKQGICSAKSHLLAAILRYLGVPTGFCYQRLYFNIGETKCIGLHGLNAVFLYSTQKWVRIDARGNKASVHAEFLVDQEQLAYTPQAALGEYDCPIIYSKPNKDVVAVLKKYTSVNEVMRNLPSELDC
ncbi:MAG: transglutaminase-like enzyme, predicted cysteine protease [Firmicutes bacterium]|nr:transglutaminase-like enzyme, predicted cysteine protease [Bacillota bacterium]